jgi:uncharacterized protein YjbJ (UPF0337 family)
MLEQIGGRIRHAFEHLLGHERTTQAQGRAEELRGRVGVEGSRAGERLEGKAQEVGGAVQRKVGEAVGSEAKAGEGRAADLEGREKQDPTKS